MKIYTKTGDQGTTSLANGERVSKSDLRIEVYGTIDELNSHLGLVGAYPIGEPYHTELHRIQSQLMDSSAVIALSRQTFDIGSAIAWMEQRIDALSGTLPALKTFVLPGGSVASAQCHVARCICRRAERLCSQLASEQETHRQVLVLLNRLSDYLFVLARRLAADAHMPEHPYVAGA